jgi:lipopolysaccharide biosynthesis glycosyltransferase
MKRDLLVTLADGNYVDQAKQLFSSVYWNAGWKGDYMLLAYDLPESKLKWFRDKGILARKCEAILKVSHVISEYHLNLLFSKFYLFTPEFKRWKNLLFLDGDIIVRGSLDALTEVKGFAAVAVCNGSGLYLKKNFRKSDGTNKGLFEELKNRYDLNRPAFNAGVLAFNTDIITKDDLRKIKDTFLYFKDVIKFQAEEKVLNLYFYDKWQELPAVYNVCPGYEVFYSGCGPHTLKGIVSHVYSRVAEGKPCDGGSTCKPWNGKSPFYAEWKSNFEKADMIDLANPQVPKKALSKKEAVEYGLYLKNLYKRHFFKYIIFRIIEIWNKWKSSKLATLLRSYKKRMVLRKP